MSTRLRQLTRTSRAEPDLVETSATFAVYHLENPTKRHCWNFQLVEVGEKERAVAKWWSRGEKLVYVERHR